MKQKTKDSLERIKQIKSLSNFEKNYNALICVLKNELRWFYDWLDDKNIIKEYIHEVIPAIIQDNETLYKWADEMVQGSEGNEIILFDGAFLYHSSVKGEDFWIPIRREYEQYITE